jgi:hypothetical protein
MNPCFFRYLLYERGTVLSEHLQDLETARLERDFGSTIKDELQDEGYYRSL